MVKTLKQRFGRNLDLCFSIFRCFCTFQLPPESGPVLLHCRFGAFPLPPFVESGENIEENFVPVDFVEHFMAGALTQLDAYVLHAGFPEARAGLLDALAVITDRVL